MLIPAAAIANSHGGYSFATVTPTTVAPGDYITVEFEYTVNITEGTASLWEVFFDGITGNRFAGVLLASGNPAVSSGDNTLYVQVFVQIPEAVENGQYPVDIFSCAWDFQPVNAFQWYVLPEPGTPITITVGQQDTTPPEITCPDDFTVYVNPGETEAVATFEVTSTDDVSAPEDIVIVCEPASGSTFQLGDTEVICTATDEAGNQATCSFIVTVEEQAVLDFFDAAVVDGTLVGIGNRPAVAQFRLDLMRILLEIGDVLIQEGRINFARFLLELAYDFTDGRPQPLDLVEGQAAPELAVRIRALIDSL